jgi:hypothetical protein
MAKQKRRRAIKSGKRRKVIQPSSAIVVLVVIGFLAFGYLWSGSRCDELGRDISRLEVQCREMSQRVNIEKAKWSRNETIDGIKNGLARWGIEMNLPPPERVLLVRYNDLLKEGVPLDQGSQYAFVMQR